MSVHYIIDGYNVIKQVPYLTEKKLQEGRDNFIRFLETARPQGSVNNEVTVVFDGYSQVYSPQMTSGVKVVFSYDETADDKIKKMVKTAFNRKRIVVVSDDKEIKFFIRKLGAQSSSVRKFLSKIKAKPFNIPSGGRDKLELMSEEAQKITMEMENIWDKKQNK
jgi:predicted RNA-binding protein with PIN domain